MKARGRGFCVMVINSNGDKIIDKAYDVFENDASFLNMLKGLKDGD